MTGKVNLVLEFHIFSSTMAPCVLDHLHGHVVPIWVLVNGLNRLVSNEFHNMLIYRYLYSLNFTNLKDYCFLRCAVWLAILHSRMRSHSHRTINRLEMVISCFLCNFGFFKLGRWIYRAVSVACISPTMYRENPTIENMQWQAKIGKDRQTPWEM